MAYCAKCGKETKEGQLYCEKCLSEMEDNTFSDLFDTLDVQPELNETSENSSDDDFAKILEELQGPYEEMTDEDLAAHNEEKQPSTVSDVFSDAVSAISSLEDELEETAKFEQELELPEKEKKLGFFARLFNRKKKDVPEGNEDTALDEKALKKAEKEKAKKEKQELAKQKKEAAKKQKEEKAKKASKGDKGKDKTKKAKKKPAKAAKPKKEKAKKPKQETEVVVEEDYGHFNVPVLIGVFVLFIGIAGFTMFRTFTEPYKRSIEVATHKFENKKYNQAYEEIYGIKVKKKDELLYDRIMTVMYVNKQLNSYNNYVELKMYPEALDSLVKGLKRYNKYIEDARELGIEEDLNYVRKQIIQELKHKFKLSEKQAVQLTKIKDQSKYSIKIYDIILENTEYDIE